MKSIDKSLLQFLDNLSENNNREWFNSNRSTYETVRRNFESFVQDVITDISVFDPIMKGLEAKSCIFRINRDTRFSNDKSIYKTNMGAFIVRGGRKNGDRFAGYYIHIEPGKSMFAGGAYMPPAPWLSAIRNKIDLNGSELRKILNNKELIKHFGALSGETLKTAPKGYPKDHPFIDLLRFKSYILVKELTDKEVTSDNFYSQTLEVCKAMKPLLDFLNDYQD
jgi:uncharacterized protein (TIGR02453 family)